LPKADEKTIDVRFQGNLMFLRAKLKEEVTFSGISGKGGETKFYEYREVIELPIVVDPNKVRIDVRKGIIRILIYK
jgi:HSP20 family molecular chaperone IbpA